MQQDAHEFLNYLLNTIADLLQEEKSQERQQNGKLVQNGSEGGGGGGEGEGGKEMQQTWVHEIFQGTLTNETRCLNCEAVSCLSCRSYANHLLFVTELSLVQLYLDSETTLTYFYIKLFILITGLFICIRSQN